MWRSPVVAEQADPLCLLRGRRVVSWRGCRLVGVQDQLERLSVEPAAGRGVGLTPQRVECALRTREDVPWVVDAVVPRSDAAGTVALTVRLTRRLHPEVGIDQRHTGARGGGEAEP